MIPSDLVVSLKVAKLDETSIKRSMLNKQVNKP